MRSGLIAPPLLLTELVTWVNSASLPPSSWLRSGSPVLAPHGNQQYNQKQMRYGLAWSLRRFSWQSWSLGSTLPPSLPPRLGFGGGSPVLMPYENKHRNQKQMRPMCQRGGLFSTPVWINLWITCGSGFWPEEGCGGGCWVINLWITSTCGSLRGGVE